MATKKKSSGPNPVEAQLKDLLKEKKADLDAIRARLTTPLPSDPTEAANARAARQLAMRRERAAREDLQRVEIALEALKNGRYGVCVTCGAAISASRMEAIPYAVRCLACKAAAD